jgi:hypothetical protein
MNQWVVYFNPKDYPGKYVVRRWRIAQGSAEAAKEATVHDSLEEARAAIPPGLYPLERFADDDRVIVEVWI